MHERLTGATAVLLVLPPLLWASNAVVGRAVVDLVAPITLNFIRWALALLILLPLGYKVLLRDSELWRHWRRYALLGLFGIGLYNSLQYLALHTSSPVNVTLVTASMPVWMMIVGRMFYAVGIRKGQVLGAALSLLGVAVVLAQGDWQLLLAFQFVPGDLLMVIATIVWAFYSWQLTQIPADSSVRAHWAGFLVAQIFFGALWSGAFSMLELGFGEAHFVWGWELLFACLFIAVGPAIIAYRCWGVGVQRVGPTIAGFFNNLTPLFAAILSLLMLGERPQLFHGLAFGLIIGGILLSSRARP